VSAQKPVREGLFALDSDGAARLVGGRCAGCGGHHFPLAGDCPFCGSSEVTEVALSPQGELWAWTAVSARPPGYRGDLPFGFGVVELPEGLRVVTRLSEADPSKLHFREPMELEVVPLHLDDEGRTVVTYSFAPAGRGGRASSSRAPGKAAAEGSARSGVER
jgi:uncharacterized OB-fold protein